MLKRLYCSIFVNYHLGLELRQTSQHLFIFYFTENQLPLSYFYLIVHHHSTHFTCRKIPSLYISPRLFVLCRPVYRPVPRQPLIRWVVGLQCKQRWNIINALVEAVLWTFILILLSLQFYCIV